VCVVELRFRDSLTSRGLSAFTVSGYLVAVRQSFAWTVDKDPDFYVYVKAQDKKPEDKKQAQGFDPFGG
jgi:hypothetical protein